MNLVQHYLDRHESVLDTREALVGRGAIEDCYGVLENVLSAGTWLVATDANTRKAAGERLTAALDARGQSWEPFRVEEVARHDPPICTDRLVDACAEAMRERNCSAGIAVGSGTINDTVKMAAHRLGRPMAVVATAPSMNGYTSGIAAILSDGVKTTNACTAPRVVVADLQVMAEAPSRMIASGLGDLISKPVSNTDWAISAELNDTPHSADAVEIIDEGAAALEGIAPRLPERNREAVRGLVESLLLSGIAMSVAGSSSPASGGEHLVSHHIDMTAHAFDRPHDLHGCQVGVGTIVSAYLYERLQEYDPSDLEIDRRVEQLPDWSTYDETLRDRFDSLYGAVVEHARPGYPSPDELRRRLQQLVDQWDDILGRAAGSLRSRSSIERELEAAGAPTRFAHLGVDRNRALRSVVHSKDIRNRYTILHLCWEIGTLEAWGTEAVDRFYD
jgi:glycerol-1-phosphate dehydrogenase [NAD(P)+]